MAGLHFDITGDNTNLLRKLRETENGVKSVSKTVEKEGGNIEELFNRLARSAAAIGVGFSAKEFISKAVQIRGEFQKLEVAFTTMLGSKEQAEKLMAQMVKTAATTPFDLQGVANGAKSLLAYGVAAEDVNKTLIRLGDIAAGLSIPLGDLVYLYGTTRAQGRLYTADLNQFTGRGIPMIQELAKQFGVAESEVKSLVEAGKVGFPEVQKVIESLTNEGGKFGGLMEAQSKTIAGQIANIEDAIDTMFNNIGKTNEGFINKALSGVSYLVENYEAIGKIIIELVGSYGAYKAVLISLSAIENLRYQSTLAYMAGLTKMQAVTEVLKAKTLALNKALMANPYVLVAAAVTALGYGIYKLATYQTDAEKAQSKLNDAIKDAEKASLSEQRELAKLKGELSALTKGTDEYNDVKDKIVKGYSKYYDGLDEEIEKVGLTEQAYLKLTEAITKSFGARQYEKFKGEQQEELDSLISDNLSKIQERLIQKLGEEQGAKFYTKIRNSVLSGNVKSINGLSKLSGLDNETQTILDKVAGEGGFLVNRSIESYIIKISSAINATEKLDKLAKERFGISDTSPQATSQNKQVIDEESNYQKDYDAAKKAWEEAKRKLEEIEKDKKTFTSKQYEDAKTDYDDKKKKYESLGGITSDKAINEAKKQAEEQLKQQEQLSEQLLSLRRKNQQEEIDLMDDGTEKKLAQIKSDYEEQKQTIEKKAMELAKANKEAGITEVNKNGLTHEQQDEINKAIFLNIQGMDKSINDLYKSSVDKYRSYTDERLAIEKKFNDDIATLQKARNNAESQGNADEVAKIDRSISKAIADKGKELIRHDFEVLKQSPEYIRAFEDLKNTSSETLNSLLTQLENAEQTAAQTLNPEDLREYTTTIQEIMDELDARDPFKALADRQKELAEAENELAEAERRLNAVNSGKKIVTGTTLGEDGKIKATYLSATDALNKYNAAKDKHQKANNNFIKAENTAREKVDELVDAIKGIGSVIGGQAGEIISLMGDVALFATSTIDGIGKVSQTGANAISAIEKASVILGIISTAIQLLQKISELGNNKAFKQYEAYAEKIKEINALTDAVNEYRIATLEAQQAESNWFSSDNLKSLRDYKTLHDEVYKAYVDKAGESQAIYKNKGGGGWLTGAYNWVMGNLSLLSWWDDWKNIWGQGDYKEGQTAAINNLRIETRKASSGFLGTGIGGHSQQTEDLVTWARKNGLGELFDDKGLVNKELAQSLIDNYGNKLVGQTKETLEALMELREQYDEYIEQLHEYVSSLYEPLVDNFVDSIWSWLDNGKNALDSFREYASDTFRDIVSDMLRTITLEKIFNNEDVWGKGESYQSQISKAYEDYASGLIDEVELNRRVTALTQKMLENAEAQLPAIEGLGKNIIETIKNETGIDLTQQETTAQSASGKGFQAMSQDTADELNGRFTALYEVGLQILQNITVLQTISVSAQGSGETLLEIKNLMILSNGHLEDISGFAKKILEGFGKKLDDINTNLKNAL